MPSSPKSIEEKIARMINAWESLAPDKTFGGMSLAQFRAAVKPAEDARARIADLEAQRTQAIADRDAANAVCLSKAQLVIAGVLGDPTEGPDSALYQAFGYTRKSERKSGLTRKGIKKAEK
jgi:hypothetical protein